MRRFRLALLLCSFLMPLAARSGAAQSGTAVIAQTESSECTPCAPGSLNVARQSKPCASAHEPLVTTANHRTVRRTDDATLELR